MIRLVLESPDPSAALRVPYIRVEVLHSQHWGLPGLLLGCCLTSACLSCCPSRCATPRRATERQHDEGCSSGLRSQILDSGLSIGALGFSTSACSSCCPSRCAAPRVVAQRNSGVAASCWFSFSSCRKSLPLHRQFLL